jgi:hypothetical protein
MKGPSVSQAIHDLLSVIYAAEENGEYPPPGRMKRPWRSSDWTSATPRGRGRRLNKRYNMELSGATDGVG